MHVMAEFSFGIFQLENLLFGTINSVNDSIEHIRRGHFGLTERLLNFQVRRARHVTVLFFAPAKFARVRTTIFANTTRRVTKLANDRNSIHQ